MKTLWAANSIAADFFSSVFFLIWLLQNVLFLLNRLHFRRNSKEAENNVEKSNSIRTSCKPAKCKQKVGVADLNGRAPSSEFKERERNVFAAPLVYIVGIQTGHYCCLPCHCWFKSRSLVVCLPFLRSFLSVTVVRWRIWSRKGGQHKNARPIRSFESNK